MSAGAGLWDQVQDLSDEGLSVPCTADPEAWTSDYPEERAVAARACGTCPVLDACRQAAQVGRERWHVWGGVDLTGQRVETDRAKAATRRAKDRRERVA